MDIKRTGVAEKKKRKRIIVFVIVVVTMGLGAWGIVTMDPPLQKVDAGSVWLETVEHGNLLREVSGIGTLVPKSNRQITAKSTGLVEEILIYPGTDVTADSVVIEMSNPQLLLDAENAKFEVTGAEARLNRLKIQLEGTLLQMESSLTQLKASHKQATMQAEVNEKLFKDGLVAELTYLQSKLNAEQLSERVELEQKRYDFQKNSNQAQIDAETTSLQSVRGRYKLLQEQVEALNVKAGFDGVLQRMLVEEGQQVGPGTLLAQAADPNLLKAVLQISETQAKDITIGQPSTIDTRNGVVNGQVMRIDPAVINGTVAVDVDITDPLPRGARPDLTVEGRIELERLNNITYVARPAFARENSEQSIYRLESEDDTALRVPVTFGRSSVTAIEVINGLNPGDRIIASDTSSFENQPRIQIR